MKPFASSKPLISSSLLQISQKMYLYFFQRLNHAQPSANHIAFSIHSGSSSLSWILAFFLHSLTTYITSEFLHATFTFDMCSDEIFGKLASSLRNTFKKNCRLLFQEGSKNDFLLYFHHWFVKYKEALKWQVAEMHSSSETDIESSQWSPQIVWLIFLPSVGEKLMA